MVPPTPSAAYDPRASSPPHLFWQVYAYVTMNDKRGQERLKSWLTFQRRLLRRYNCAIDVSSRPADLSLMRLQCIQQPAIEQSPYGFPAYIFGRQSTLSSTSSAQIRRRSWQLQSPSPRLITATDVDGGEMKNYTCNFNARQCAPDVTDAFATAAVGLHNVFWNGHQTHGRNSVKS